MQKNSDIFTQVAQQHGFTAHMARTTLDMTGARLRGRGHAAHGYFYIYRTGGSGVGGDGRGHRPRAVLAFANADSALAFVQRNELGPPPRLMRVSIAQLLAIMIQRATIDAVIFVDEPVDGFMRNRLPAGLRIDRVMLLTMLKGVE